MESLTRACKFIVDELGGKAIYGTGRNAYIIIASRALRMFAHGTVTLILGMLNISLSHSFSSRTDSCLHSAISLGNRNLRLLHRRIHDFNPPG